MFYLISGGGGTIAGNADSSVIVQEACEYYRINQDFSLEHQIALKSCILKCRLSKNKRLFVEKMLDPAYSQ